MTFNSLRVATYNLSCMSQQAKNKAQAQLLEEQKVDLVGLQEVNWKNRRFSATKYNTLDYFEAFQNHFFGEASPFGGGYGNAIVSHLPFLDQQNWHYDNGPLGKEHESELVAAYANIDESKPATIQASNDLFAKYGLNMIEPRAYQRVVIEFNQQSLAFYNTHLSFEFPELRISQMQQLKHAVLSDPTPYKIITGDFNADLNTTDWQVFRPEFQLANGYQGTWHDTFIGLDPAMKVNSIDNIIVTPNIKLTHIYTVKSMASDHLPLIADLQLL